MDAKESGKGNLASAAAAVDAATSILDEVVDKTTLVANELLGSLVQREQYVGESWNVDYDEITIQVHDDYKNLAGGIPQGCFLIATRLAPGKNIASWNDEDAAVILLRVKGSQPLWNESEVHKIRIEAGQRATGEDGHWHDQEHMDAYTHHAFAWSGIKCAVLGTYYLKRPRNPKDDADLMLAFGSDISNFYPNKGLKVYKPTNDALERLVNHRDAERMADHPLAAHVVQFGRIRYTSVDRGEKGIDNVKVFFSPLDLLGQKTALFGMTRVGKSNTTKVIAKSVYELRTKEDGNGPRVGQLIFDVNGEYANENFQDAATGAALPNALRNVWKLGGSKGDVVIYGQSAPLHDPTRKVTKINFYDDGEMLNVGKRLIHGVFEEQSSMPNYVRSFVAVEYENPGPGRGGEQTRFARQLLVYRALLYRAGFAPPAGLLPNTTGLFGKVLDAMKAPKALNDAPPSPSAPQQKKLDEMATYVVQDDRKAETADRYDRAARVLEKTNPAWPEIIGAFEILKDFVGSKTYNKWNQTVYSTKLSSSGSDWADATLIATLGMFGYTAYKIMKEVSVWHEPDAEKDYVDEIYASLEQGKMVIVDQSLGDPELNALMAQRIAERIFRGNSRKFATGVKAIDMSMLLYVEEAHNLLPDKGDKDVKNIWSRIVKEGGKFGIGVVYATQEPSSIQGNILKNTANWFVGHLASTEETREVNKSYDFADFEKSILHAQDRGFMRVKTLSNSFVIPVQIDKFEV